MPNKSDSTWCGVKNCQTRKNQSKLGRKVSFFRFPKEPDRLKQWIQNTERYDLTGKTPQYCNLNVRLCGSHFEDKMFLNDVQNRLQPHAVPTVFPGSRKFLSFPHRTCSVPSCLIPSTRYVGFPVHNPKLLKQWFENINIPNLCLLSHDDLLKKHVICSKHFESKHIELCPSKSKSEIITENAVPTMHLNDYIIPGSVEFDNMHAFENVPIDELPDEPEEQKSKLNIVFENCYRKDNNDLYEIESKMELTDDFDSVEMNNRKSDSILKSILLRNKQDKSYKEESILNDSVKQEPNYTAFFVEVLDPLTTYCRFCAHIFPATDLKSLFNDPLSEEYLEILNLYAPGMCKKDDNLPQEICEPCLNKLESCMFTLKCFEKAHEDLKKIFNQTKTDDLQKMNNEPEVITDILPILDSSLKPQFIPTITPEQIIEKADLKQNLIEAPIETTDTEIVTHCCLKCDEKFQIHQEFLEHSFRVHLMTKSDKIVSRIIRSKKTPLQTQPIDALANKTDHNQENTYHVKFECLICHLMFDKKYTLVRHTMVHHSTAKRIKYSGRMIRTDVIKCTRCTETFQDLNSYNQHTKKHVPFKCDECGVWFNRQQKLMNHRKLHCLTPQNQTNTGIPKKNGNKTSLAEKRKYTTKKKTQKSLLCNICGTLVKNHYYMKYHQLVHTNERPFKCDKCPKRFKIQQHLDFHHKIHDDTGERNCMCQICGKCFRTAPLLRKHIQRHSENKPYVCEVCGHAFLSSFLLERHRKCHNVLTDTKTHRCRICHILVDSFNGLFRHMSEKHDGAKALECDICHKLFKKQLLLKCHRRTHTGERPYQCEQCSKTFTTSALLKQHMAVHEKESLQCDVCDKKFRRLWNLVTHQKKHEFDTAQHVCLVCNKLFGSRSSLAKHFRVHKAQREEIESEEENIEYLEELESDEGELENVEYLDDAMEEIVESNILMNAETHEFDIDKNVSPSLLLGTYPPNAIVIKTEKLKNFNFKKVY